MISRSVEELEIYSRSMDWLWIVTGKRKTLVASMRHSDIDAEGFWSPPQLRNKRGNKRRHGIPLPWLALDIIRDLPKVEGIDYLFPPGKDDNEHLTAGDWLVQKIRNLTGIANFKPHVLRHSVETHMGALNIDSDTRDLLLDHVPKRGAGKGYDHNEYRDEKLDALEAWANKLTWPQQAPKPEDVPRRERPRELWRSYLMGPDAYTASLEPPTQKRQQKNRRQQGRIKTARAA